MAIKIKPARSPKSIDDVLKLRHKVFCEEEKYFRSPHPGRVIDQFDALPTTCNMIAVHENEVVGALRLNFDADVGMPSDKFYDFRSRVPANSKLMSSGMFCVTRKLRNEKLALGLIMMGTYYAISNNVTHIVAPINPPIAPLLKNVGFEALDDKLHNEESGLDYIPMMLDLTKLTDFFVSFSEQNRIHNFISSYNCYFFKPEEHIIKTGETGEVAYVIIDGEVEVRLPGSNRIIATMGPGEVVGELALLTNDIRTADVFAKGDVKAMGLSKEVFLQHLKENPDHATLMLKSIGTRLKEMIDNQAKMT